MLATYEIHVAGHLPPGALRDFGRLTVSPCQNQTMVHGPLEDQEEFRQLLARLETLGADLLELHRLAAGDPGLGTYLQPPKPR